MTYLIQLFLLSDRRRASSRKRTTQMLNRSFGKGMSGGFSSNGCLDLGSKPTTPTFGNGTMIPDTIVEEEDVEDTLDVESAISPSPSTSNLIDLSPDIPVPPGSASQRKQKASLHLQALRTDEGLGESIDLNSEHSNYSPKLPDKFDAEPPTRLSKHERNLPSELDPDFNMLSHYSPGDGHTDRSGKRVTFL